MKNLIIITVLSFLTQVGVIYGQGVSLTEAKTVAMHFYKKYSPHPSESSKTSVLDVLSVNYGEFTVLYGVNFYPEGFVLVSASKNCIPVCAYSFNGRYDSIKMPPAVEAWVEMYKKTVFASLTNNAPSFDVQEKWEYYLQEHPESIKVKEVAPLLTSKWNQDLYYNEHCPDDPMGPGGHCYAGCVATAMGQVMNYFRWPLNGSGYYSYNCPPYGMQEADFENTQYIWNEMSTDLSRSNPAVAGLLYHLGVSVDMQYGPNGSGMYNHKAAYSMKTHFRYSPETQYVFRDSTSMTWDSLLISHLDRSIPLYYAGWSVPNVSGHAFVCDGYQEIGYYHFN